MTHTSNTFLGAVARRHKDSAATKTFITPTRRSALLLNRALADAGATAGRIITLDMLLQQLAGRRKAGRLMALVALHRCWQETAKADMPLEQFLPLGEALLQDLDDAERAGILFKDLPRDVEEVLADGDDDAKALLAAMRKSALADDLRTTWPLLAPLQEALRKALAEKGSATPGQMTALAAKAAQTMPSVARILATEEAVAVGLADMGASERVVFERLAREGRLEMDMDLEGTGAVGCAAAEGVRKANTVEGAMLWQPMTACDPQDQEWDVIHAATSTGQGRVAAAVVEAVIGEGAAEEEVAIVLADRSLLQPVLDAMPSCVKKVNVTMGLGVADGSAATLLEQMTRLLEGLAMRGEAVTAHHRNVEAVLENALVRQNDAEAAAAMLAAVRGAGRIRVPLAELAEMNDLGRALFGGAVVTGALAWTRGVIERLQKTATAMEREHLYVIHHCLGTVAETTGCQSGATLLRLTAKALRTVTLPLEGEPAEGLQVMGPMETRCLDYLYVIYVGASEGMLPAGGDITTTMPAALRKSLGLPLPSSFEERGEYNLWRSTCRARHTWLIHDSRTDGMTTGEPTRMAAQLRYLHGVTPKEATAADNPGGTAVAAPVVEKTPDVLQALHDKYLSGSGAMSATSINTYLDCRLRWWREHVLGIRQRDDVKDSFDAALFGTVVHGALEALYRPRIGETLTAAQIEALAEEVPQMVARAMEEAGIHDMEGATPVLAGVAERTARRVLESDAKAAPLTILGTETKLDRKVRLSCGQVRLFGITDRMDRPAGEDGVRVVDYKTGSVKGHDDTSDACALFDRSLGAGRPGIGLQLYLYEYLTRGMHGETEHKACVYATRDLFSGKEPQATALDEDGKAAFEEALRATLEEMFDPAVPITPREADDEICERCPLRVACGR